MKGKLKDAAVLCIDMDESGEYRVTEVPGADSTVALPGRFFVWPCIGPAPEGVRAALLEAEGGASIMTATRPRADDGWVLHAAVAYVATGSAFGKEGRTEPSSEGDPLPGGHYIFPADVAPEVAL